jgi:hypothetical protein
VRLKVGTVKPIFLFVALVVIASAAFAEPVRVPGTSVTMTPPEGFTLADRFSGFEREDSSASIIVTEIPGPVAELRAGMTQEALAQQGMNILESRQVTAGGRDAFLFHIEQTIRDESLQKWLILTGNESRSIMVVASFRKEDADALGAPLKQSLLALQWNPAEKLDPLEGLPFRIKETPSLKIAHRVSNVVMLTESGSAATLGPADPVLVVGSSLDNVEIGNVESFSKQRLWQMPQIKDITVLHRKEKTVGGMSAYEMTADAVQQEHGTPLRVYQLIATDRRGYFVVQGFVGRARGDEFVAQFRKVAESLARPK